MDIPSTGSMTKKKKNTGATATKLGQSTNAFRDLINFKR
jgi:hypothetical protein